jgi:hypothetical protein
VCPTKYTFVKIKSRENFGEFIRFFPQGLNPFKIHRIFKYLICSSLFIMTYVGILNSEVSNCARTRQQPPPHCRALGFAPPPHVHPDSASTIAVAPRFLQPIERVRGRGKFPTFPFHIPHASAPALPPLCASKPSPTCSQVECPSRS